MKQANENIIIQLTNFERKFVKIYHDFLDNSFLTTEEQMIFIVLKSFVNFKGDDNEVYPSMETICKRAKMSEKRVRKNINTLIKKGIVKKTQRGLAKTNLYTLSDYAKMWACDDVEDIASIIDNKGIKPLTAEEHISELEKMGYKVEIKEKEPNSAIPTKVETELSSYEYHSDILYNNTSISEKSQDLISQRYTIEKIQQLFEYDIIIHDYPYQQENIDAAMEVLKDALNTTKQTFRILEEDKPTEAVISRLIKLNKDSIMYAVQKFSEQTNEIKNLNQYLLTILYNAPVEYPLYIQNKFSQNNST